MEDSDFIIPNGGAPKKASIPQFYMGQEPSPFLTAQHGRPMHRDVEMVRIIIPGDSRSQMVREVTDEDRERWPREYRAFKNGIEAPVEGTALKDWPQVSGAQVLNFAALHIRSVEDLAGVGDNNLQNLGMGARELREKARRFLEMSKGVTGPLSRIIDDNAALKAENAQLKANLELQADSVRGMSARLDAMESARV